MDEWLRVWLLSIPEEWFRLIVLVVLMILAIGVLCAGVVLDFLRADVDRLQRPWIPRGPRP